MTITLLKCDLLCFFLPKHIICNRIEKPLGLCPGWEIMGRAFREGIETSNKMSSKELQEGQHGVALRGSNLSGLMKRAMLMQSIKMKSEPIPALLTMENDEWIWQMMKVEQMGSVSHRIVLQSDSPFELAHTSNFSVALTAANEIAEKYGKPVLIEPVA